MEVRKFGCVVVRFLFFFWTDPPGGAHAVSQVEASYLGSVNIKTCMHFALCHFFFSHQTRVEGGEEGEDDEQHQPVAKLGELGKALKAVHVY